VRLASILAVSGRHRRSLPASTICDADRLHHSLD
jgi:hypothetical protein